MLSLSPYPRPLPCLPYGDDDDDVEIRALRALIRLPLLSLPSLPLGPCLPFCLPTSLLCRPDRPTIPLVSFDIDLPPWKALVLMFGDILVV